MLVDAKVDSKVEAEVDADEQEEDFEVTEVSPVALAQVNSGKPEETRLVELEEG